MPYIVNNKGFIFANPVMGTFIESLAPFFKNVIVFGFETNQRSELLTYDINHLQNVNFISLGPQGRFWDYISKIRRVKKAIESNDIPLDILLLRAPSQLAHTIWKFAGKPPKTALMLIGNKFFTPAYNSYGSFLHLFFRWRSEKHDRNLYNICKKSKVLLMANSSSLCNIWQEELKFPVNRIHTSSLSEKDLIPLDDIREKFSRKPYRILFVGRVCYDKGIRELFQAVRELNLSEDDPVYLDVVGPLGNLEGKDFNQLTKEFMITKVVSHHGAVPFGRQLFRLYQNADVYCLPSYHEGMPKTIWEAMSQGTPVMVSALDGIKEHFINNKDLLLFEPRNADAIAEAFRKIEKSPELARKLQKNGRERVNKITREQQAAQIIHLMQERWF